MSDKQIISPRTLSSMRRFNSDPRLQVDSQPVTKTGQQGGNNYIVSPVPHPEHVDGQPIGMPGGYRAVKGYGDIYIVNRFGAVRSWVNPERELVPRLDRDGYALVTLASSKRRVTARIHRLVAEAWVPNPQGLLQVNHINGIKSDNRAENLEWVSVSENAMHWRVLRKQQEQKAPSAHDLFIAAALSSYLTKYDEPEAIRLAMLTADRVLEAREEARK